MGQVIAFPVLPTPFPDRAADLDRSECVLLIAIRSWVECYRNGEDPFPCLLQGLETVGAPDAAFSIDGLMTVVARAVTHSVDIHCPRCPELSLDEKHLLHAASLAQAEQSQLAETVLRTTLLSAQGASFAMGPLEGVAALFAQGRLMLSRRRLANEAPQSESHRSSESNRSEDSRETWSPPRSLH